MKWRGRDGENGKGRDIWGGGVEKEIGENIRVKWRGREDEGKKRGKIGEEDWRRQRGNRKGAK